MSKIINLNEGGIKENIESINKRLILAYSMLLFIFIGFIVFDFYISYITDPEFFIRPALFFVIIMFPFIIYSLTKLIKTKIYLNDFTKCPVYKRISEIHNLNNIPEFEKFDRTVTKEVNNNLLFNFKKSKIMGTESFIITYGLPVNSEFNVFDPSKLLLVVFNPVTISDLVIRPRSKAKTSHELILYFEDRAFLLFANTKKEGQEIADNLANTYKVLQGNNLQLERFYEKDREKFIQSCREQIKNIYSSSNF
ncbi:hypothetical protein [Clostridium sporogenes]|uniref:hypothetical protein n=1 Tax=Clostridium sporogenes TaxID=1509 RepID=UPI0022379AE7|nr:hypothetical protein [Clostridium sporogenes]MCW6111033.1 hypothetical protein [Clostridium sporogenes]